MTDNANADTISDLFRTLGAVLNSGIYFLLGLMYQIFFNVSSAQLFENETIKNFYSRIQLIIGVFMIFKLAVTILQGIMNPEQFASQKEGFGNFITRVVISLALLTVLVPINIPNVQDANSFEKYINNNGLLFGTLYSLQDRILSNNTLGRLILGTEMTDQAVDNSNTGSTAGMTQADIQNQKLQKSARIFTSTILKAFLRINLLPEESRVDSDETNQDNWYCGQDLSSDASTAIDTYSQLDIAPETLMSSAVIHADCNINGNIFQNAANVVSNVIPIFSIGGKSRYVFAFNWILALVIGVVFLVLLALFTVDIAIRSIKLSILRLLAPIPVISYIEPKSSKDGGMFSSWVKALTSTYLDLFLRLAIVYFVIFLIQDMIANGIIMNEASGIVGIISVIFIWIGLFFFAKMAPKFIKDVLGIKGSSMTNFGLGGFLAAAGALKQGGGLRNAMYAAQDSARAQTQAYNQGKPLPGLGDNWNMGADLAAKMLTGDDHMTAAKRNRGRGFLRSEGISQDRYDNLHDEMLAEQNLLEKMKNHLAYGQGDFVYKDKNGDTKTLKRDKLIDAISDQTKRVGKLQSADSKMEAEMKRWGAAPGYKAKQSKQSNATFFDSVRNAGRTASYFGEDLKHMVSNGAGTVADAAKDAVNWHGIDNRVENRQAHEFQYQQDLTDSRNTERSEGRAWAEDGKDYHDWTGKNQEFGGDSLDDDYFR